MPKYYSLTTRIYTEEVLNGGKMRKPKYAHHSDMKAMFGDNVPEEITGVIAMSDIHSVTGMTIDSLIKKKTINKGTIVISTGDMAGTGKSGKDGDANPYDDYLKIIPAAHSFYLVQGNHDIYDERIAELTNSDGSPCCVHGHTIQTPIGTIGGINGIVNPDNAVDHTRHKYSAKEYVREYRAYIDNPPDIFLTHQPPDQHFKPFASIHMFGHCHWKDYHREENGCLLLNMDSRVIKFV